MYKVYKIDPIAGYHGFSLVAAESPKEANKFIKDYKAESGLNSEGYGTVSGYTDKIEGVFSEHKGIIYRGIDFNFYY